MGSNREVTNIAITNEQFNNNTQNGENLLDHLMHHNWLFFPPFLFPPKKKREGEKWNELAKPVIRSFFFNDPIDFQLKNYNFVFWVPKCFFRRLAVETYSTFPACKIKMFFC